MNASENLILFWALPLFIILLRICNKLTIDWFKVHGGLGVLNMGTRGIIKVAYQDLRQ